MTTPLSPEILVPRLGDTLVQSGILSREDLKKALAYQEEKQKSGNRFYLGQALVELRLLDRIQLDHAVTEQIIQLRTALEDANLFLERRVQERTAELQDALKKLSELSQMKANFVANISHELRTPLTHIKGYLELLVTGSMGGLTEEQTRVLTISQRATRQLESLIENLISFSHVERGEMTLRMSAVDITRVAEEAIHYSQEKAQSRGVILENNCAQELPPLQADKEKVAWVILQLLDNAIKFTPSGGTVRLSIQPEIQDLVMVAVSDTGIGMPNKRMAEIFEAFHQLDGSPTRRYGGTGLGLALVRDIIQAHGSVIEVESVEGKGSTFRFPLLKAKAVT